MNKKTHPLRGIKVANKGMKIDSIDSVSFNDLRNAN